MDDAVPMRDFQGFSNLSADPKGLLDGQSSFREAISQSLAFQILHYQKIKAILRTDVIEGAYIRML
jgi:hypothetical protein